MIEKEPSEDRRMFKIHRIESDKMNAIEFSPERGGIITSVVLGGKEVLYMNKRTFNDPDSKVRGGIPILIPNAGPAESGESQMYPDLPKHGFARSSSKWNASLASHTFKETLSSDDSTRAMFPHEFEFQISGTIEGAGFVLEQKATNTGSEPMPVAFGLHPYFPVPHAQKQNVRFEEMPAIQAATNAEGETLPDYKGRSVEQCADVWMNDGTVSITNSAKPIRVIIPGLGTLVLEASPEYERYWVWSEPGKDFVCIEPVMRDEGGLASDPQLIKPGQSYSARFTIRLE